MATQFGVKGVKGVHNQRGQAHTKSCPVAVDATKRPKTSPRLTCQDVPESFVARKRGRRGRAPCRSGRRWPSGSAGSGLLTSGRSGGCRTSRG
jgi:hypothetical protein